ncbi:MAG TPA: c-type cytochrome [Solirubrobacteraceae bacterium]|nr:c-type cytochrome [Solirubrobacteraceae bacterium]
MRARRLLLRAAPLLVLPALVAACGGSGGAKTSSSGGDSLAATGRHLYAADGCEDCHTLNGSPGTGPSWKGLYLSRVHLASGKTVLANAAYLERHIVDPDALTVAGFPGQVMGEAIGGEHLGRKPADVRALVAFIETLR